MKWSAFPDWQRARALLARVAMGGELSPPEREWMALHTGECLAQLDELASHRRAWGAASIESHALDSWAQLRELLVTLAEAGEPGPCNPWSGILHRIPMLPADSPVGQLADSLGLCGLLAPE